VRECVCVVKISSLRGKSTAPIDCIDSMQPGQGQHDSNMRGFSGYMPSQGMPYNMQQQQQQQQQHGQGERAG
jgi:hypothetical protein